MIFKPLLDYFIYLLTFFDSANSNFKGYFIYSFNRYLSYNYHASIFLRNIKLNREVI